MTVIEPLINNSKVLQNIVLNPDWIFWNKAEIVRTQNGELHTYICRELDVNPPQTLVTATH